VKSALRLVAATAVLLLSAVPVHALPAAITHSVAATGGAQAAGATLVPPARLAADNFVIGYWPEQRGLAERVLRMAQGTRLPALPEGVLGRGDSIVIQIAPDEARFAALTGGRVPHWGAGVAFPALGLIVIPAHRAATGQRGELGRIMVHELAHIALHRYLEPARIPRWFNEGYATWSAGQLDFEAGWLLRVAFMTRRAPPLDSLEIGWPEGATDARIAYLLSASVLQFLHDRGGEFALRRFLERWQEGQTFEQALFRTYGLTVALLERDWSRDVRRRYGWLTFFAQGVVIWTMLTLLVLLLFVVRRRRDRRRFERLKADELPEAPAFWVEGFEEPDGDADLDAGSPPDRPPPA
jgi:hypothetical protein